MVLNFLKLFCFEPCSCSSDVDLERLERTEISDAIGQKGQVVDLLGSDLWQTNNGFKLQ